jgi:cell division protein FtsA
MSERNIFAALDIGTNTVICLIGSDSGENKINVLGHSIVSSSGVRRGVVVNVEEVATAIKRAVDKASINLDVTVRKVYVNVAGHNLHTVERKLTKYILAGKIISKVDVKQLFEDARELPIEEGEKVYHVITQSYSVDGETGINNPIGITGNELIAEYRLIIGPSNYENTVRNCIERAGLEMVKCVVNPVAAAEAVLTDDEKEAGVVVVDLGGGTTSISIYHDNVLRHLGMIPFGGNVVTNDIREGCSIVLRQAESLKVQYGAAMGEHVRENLVVTIPGINGWEPKEISFRSLAYIIQARMEEIIESVYYQVEKSGYAEKLGAGIVVTGGGAKLKGLRQLVLFKTALDVRVGKPINGFVPENDKPIDSPQFATAFGLLKKAVKDQNAQNDELINKKPKAKKLRTNYGESFMQKLSLFFNEEQDAAL